MQTHQNAYVAFSALAPVALAALFFAMAGSHWAASLGCALAVALLMEGRVQIGGRTAHDLFFYVHIVFAVLLFACLFGVLALRSSAAFFALWAWVCVVPTAAAGAVLWYRGLKKTLAYR